MCNRLLKGGAAQRLIAGLAPPFDRRIGEARLREMFEGLLVVDKPLRSPVIVAWLTFSALAILSNVHSRSL
jgi:hypothetical protein